MNRILEHVFYSLEEMSKDLIVEGHQDRAGLLRACVSTLREEISRKEAVEWPTVRTVYIASNGDEFDTLEDVKLCEESLALASRIHGVGVGNFGGGDMLGGYRAISAWFLRNFELKEKNEPR